MNNITLESFFKKYIAEAIRKVEESYPGSEKRPWLKTNLDSYQSESNRVTLYVLEGSPCKGYVIVNYGSKYIRAFNAWNKQIYQCNVQSKFLNSSE